MFGPAGFTLSPDGVVAGETKKAGTYRFHVYVVDAVGGASDAMVSLTVEPGPLAELLFFSAPVAGPPSSEALLGPVVIGFADQYGNRLPAPPQGLVVGLSASPTSVFATTPGGPPVTKLDIPGGAQAGVVYFGDSIPEHPSV